MSVTGVFYLIRLKNYSKNIFFLTGIVLLRTEEWWSSLRRIGSLVVSVPASIPPVTDSNIGP